MEKEKKPEFTSAQSRWEHILALVYIPIHIVLLPSLALWLLNLGSVDMQWLNFSVYAAGLVFMLITQRRFLRREFDALCDNTLGCIIQVLFSYGAMLCFNLLVSLLLMLVLGDEQVANPNNEAVMELSRSSFGSTSAMAIFMAPIIEELMFRAGVFGALRKRSRVAAYVLSMLVFSLYHVWQFAITDPFNLIYIIQYLPISYLLCRCYERTNTIWAPMFLHMLVNSVSVAALDALGAI